MQLRAFGATGVSVSRLGLGLAALGRPAYLNLGHGDDLAGQQAPEQLRQRAWTVLDAAWAAGVRYYDAARSYGQAESVLGDWLRARGHRPAGLTVGSKWGYTYTAGWRPDAAVHEVKDHTLPTLERQWPESRARLGDWLRLYLIHSATLESGVLDDPGVQRRLAELRGGGIVVGLSLSGPGQAATLRRALGVQVGGQPLFGAVQATWNLLEPSVGAALTEAHAAGWGVVIKEGVANGRLTGRNPSLPPPLLAACRELHAAPDALALAAVLAQPWADVVLSGASDVAQLRSNLGALALTLPADLLDGLAEAPAAYWQTRAALPWS